MGPNIHRKMKILHFFVLAAYTGLALCSNTELSSDKCDSFKNCICFKTMYYEIQCPLEQPDVVINLLPDKYIDISCEDQDSYKLDTIPNVNVNVETFRIRFCALPIYQFKNVLQKFNITNLKKLTIEQCVLGDKKLQQINSSFLENISSLQSISISYSTITFKENLLEQLPNLVQVYLELNNLTEIGYMFEKNPKLKTLHLSRNSLKTLPDNIFNKLSDLQELHLWKNNLTNITQNYFIGLKKLKSLELSINSINFIDEKAFSELYELVEISLRSNQLETIKSNIFRNNTKLKSIRIGRNPNLILSDYVFANLSSLINISMDHCNLKNLPEHVFENSHNMTFLDIQNNSIEILPQNIFRTLKNLQKLILSKNRIVSLPAQLFSSLEKLEVLDLGENALTNIDHSAFEGLSNLKTLILKNNMILNIEIAAFSFQKKLNFLDLSNNQWSGQSETFSYLVQIQHLILHHNKISEFLGDFIGSAVYLKEIDLSYNNLDVIYVASLVTASNYDVKINVTYNSISYINFDDAIVVAKLNNKDKDDAFHHSNSPITQIEISHNPLICDCRNFELVQYLQDKIDPAIRRFTDIIIQDDTCYEPEDYKHIRIKDLSPKHISCKYKSKGCPSECSCFERPYDTAVVIDCSFRNLTQLPNLHDIVNRTVKHKLEVNLVGNSIEFGPQKDQGYETVKNLFLSYNKLKSFDWCPPKIQELKLDHNNIQVLKSDVLKTLITSTNFSMLTLENNPWSCGCSALDLQNFLRDHFHQVKVNNVVCEDKIALIDKKEMCKSKVTLIMQIVIPILLLFLISATLLALYFRYKQEIKIWLFSKNCCLWFVTEDELDKDKKYDIFLSFSHKDEDFVAQNLVPSLEKSYQLCIHTRDFIPGELINDQIVDSVYNSRRTLVVLSNNFLESAWGKLEFLLAHKQSIDEGRPRVIVIKLGDLNSDKMSDEFKAYIKTNTYVEWGEPWFWKKLLYALPHLNKNASKTNQKHANMMLKIDDKFELVSSQMLSQPESTPPVISIDDTLLKKQPLNFNMSGNINSFHPEVPLIKNK